MEKENLFTKSGVKSKKAKANYFTGAVSAKDISATIKPTNENPSRVTPDHCCCPLNSSYNLPAITVPVITAAVVPN